MNIISVEHLSPIMVVSKGKSVTSKATSENLSQKLHLQQARNVPPLTMISKGKAITTNAASANLLMQRVNNPPPLANITKSKYLDQPSAKKRMPKGKIPRLQLKPISSAQKQITFKKYDTVSAPAPFFGPFKSQIPKVITTQPEDSMSQSQPFVDLDLVSYVHTDLNRNEMEWPQNESLNDPSNLETEYIEGGAASLEYPNDIIIETADKAIQTECFCQCNSEDHGIKQALEDVVAKVTASLDDLKLNITGKTATKTMAGIFPIKSERDLTKIDYNMENTENFELRLKLFLKYLKPKSSTIITTAFKELIDDKFLIGKNWDGSGSNDPTAINKFTFFETTLFEAWKNSVFTKDVYVAAMKQEIKKAHDRESKRKRKRTE